MTTSIKKSPEYNRKFQKIVDYKNKGDLSKALQYAKKISEEYQNIGSAFGLLASIYFELDDYKNAAENFKKATIISPKSEMASLGLFHSLWETGDRDRAFKEMKRFLAISQSDEYKQLLKELNET